MKKNSIPEGEFDYETKIIAAVAGYYDDPAAAAEIISSYIPRLKKVKDGFRKLLIDEQKMYERRVANNTPRSLKLLEFNLESLVEPKKIFSLDCPTPRTPSLEDYDKVGILVGVMRESLFYVVKKGESNEQFVARD